MNILKRLLIWLGGKLPFFQILSPFWKPVVKKLIIKQGDILQINLIRSLALHGPESIDRNVDEWQKDINLLIGGIPLPDYIRARILSWLNSHADQMQIKLKETLAAKGLPAINQIFDELQDSLLAKIDLL